MICKCLSSKYIIWTIKSIANSADRICIKWSVIDMEGKTWFESYVLCQTMWAAQRIFPFSGTLMPLWWSLSYVKHKSSPTEMEAKSRHVEDTADWNINVTFVQLTDCSRFHFSYVYEFLFYIFFVVSEKFRCIEGYDWHSALNKNAGHHSMLLTKVLLNKFYFLN